MKSINKKNLFTIIISFACLVFALVFFTVKVNATEEVKEVIAKFEDEYILGSEIKVPDVYFLDGSNQVKGNKVIIYPDGSQYVRDVFVPKEIGNYIIEYSATISSGEYLVETKNINVYDYLYQLQGVGNSSYYGSHELTPSTSGLCVSLSNSGQFVYNKVIDLANLDSTIPFISMYMTPETIREFDAEEFIIRLTDVYDNYNYVEIKVSSTRQTNTYKHGIVYIQGASSSQEFTGIEENMNKVHINNIYGFPQDVTFFGCDTTGKTNESFLVSKEGARGQLQLFFDVNNKILSTQGNSLGYNKIIDLDDPRYFSDLWDGFTTGEVILSISSKAIVKNTMNFVITEIAGETLETNRLVDEVGPQIHVDTLGYEKLPNAILRQSYPIFDSTARDAYSSNVSTDVAVYMNYGSPTQRNVNIEDGKFTPLFKGNYYIVYTSKDYSGNISEKVYMIECVETGEEINLYVEHSEIVASAYVGEVIKLPYSSANGGIGSIDINTSVLDPDGNEVEVVDGKFKLTLIGKYHVKYTAIDFVSSLVTYDYEIEVTTSNKPVFEGDVQLFDYYISGYEYTLPELKAYDYSDGGKEVEVSIKIQDDEGEKELDSTRKGVFVLNEIGTIKAMKLIYECSNSNGVTSKIYEINVVNAKKLLNGNQRLDVSKYFSVDDGIEVEITETETIFSTSSDGCVDFINPILAPNSSISLFMVHSNSLGALKLTLQDIYDSNKNVEVIISRNKNGKTSCTINNQNPYDINISYTEGQYLFCYDSLNKKFSIDGDNYTTINQYKDGKIFEGFPSNVVNLSIEFIDVTNNVSVAITNISGQEFNSKTLMDRVSPRIYAYTTGTRVKEINEVVTIHPAVACDVLDPEVQISVRVLGPNNQPISSIDNILLDNVDGSKEYQIKLSEYGSYTILYSTLDDSGNDAGASLSFRVLDAEKPEIKLSRDNVTTAKKNDIIVIASATVTDNSSSLENMTVCCFVVRPTGSIFTINMKDSNSFVANECGVYKIRYMVLDETGNTILLEQQVTVTE